MESNEYRQLFTHEADHWWYRALRRQFARELKRLPLAADKQYRWLDAGCGTGKILQTFTTTNNSMGLDFSREALGWCRRRFDSGSGCPPLLQASIETIPLRDEAFDLILSADVLYHRGVADDTAALRELARCLRPGGYLLLNLPAFNWLYSSHDVAIHTARRYTARDLTAKLTAAGLTPVRVRYWNWLLFAPLALMRLLRKPRGAERVPKSDLYSLPLWLNGLLDGLLKLESSLAAGSKVAGLSVFAVARKD